MCKKCNGSEPTHTCPCKKKEVVRHICGSCPPETPCDCPVRDLSTDCSIYKGDDVKCGTNVVIAKNRILTDALKDIVSFFCAAIEEIKGYLKLKNIGAGAKIYKGDSLLGEKELRTITNSDTLITIDENLNEIGVGVNEVNLTTFIENLIPDFPTPPDGSETKLTAGINVTITGNGTTATPYVVNSSTTTGDGSETKINAGTNVTITGTGTIVNPYVINSKDTIADGSETKIQNGTTTTVTGNGTTANPYEVEIENLQKTINTFPYTLTNNDDKYTIFIDNVIDNVTINVPNSLVQNFSCVFIQKGSGEVTIQQTGTATLLLPSDLQNKIKGQNNWAMIEKEQATDTYYLIGRLKI